MDLKADRARGTLLVQGAFAEDTIRTRAGMNGVAEALGAELALMAGWLGLERVTVMRNGALAGALARQRINVGA
ncbi:unannotated protein [freshwater metagenome]|uniref:Unannotated protein n=1 Tax=freshwater metagenome TaxID=449393 RepID=A0A6J6VX98_9ZZZZ